MDNFKKQKSLEYIADSLESGYSSMFTYAAKEFLDAKERRELANILRDQAKNTTDSRS